jgi:hypothetical protein
MEINELTYKINGAIFEVNSELGAGFLEKVLEKYIPVCVCPCLSRLSFSGGGCVCGK